MRRQSGMTMVELLVVTAVGSMVLMVTVVYSTSWMATETMRSSAYDVAGLMQLAKIEAVSRNSDCRFVLDTSSGMLEVWDSVGTDDLSDDELVHSRRVSDAIAFDRPDFGSPVTLELIGTTASYQTTFTSDGVVSSGIGGVYLHGGDGFGSVNVYAAGAIEIQRWDGTEWQIGF